MANLENYPKLKELLLYNVFDGSDADDISLYGFKESDLEEIEELVSEFFYIFKNGIPEIGDNPVYDNVIKRDYRGKKLQNLINLNY